MLITPIATNTTPTPLTRAHKLYGTAPTFYNRVVTYDRRDFTYICSSIVNGGSFSSSGLPSSLVGDANLISIALDDTGTYSASVLDRVQIGT